MIRYENVALPGLNGDHFTFDVPKHRGVFVVGAESSGVDELGRYALGLRQPDAGRVVVDGIDVATLPRRAALAFRRRVGYLPAGDGLLHNLSLRDNIALPMRFGSNLLEREIGGRLRVMLAQLRLVEVADRQPADVTNEQRRRASLARALAFDPGLLILEDPFDGLTDRTAAELLEIARGGEVSEGSRRTVFMIGHSIPSTLEPRIELRYRVARGTFEQD